MALMCPENRRMVAWVDEHAVEAAAWAALHLGRDLADLTVWERCDLGWAMLTAEA